MRDHPWQEDGQLRIEENYGDRIIISQSGITFQLKELEFTGFRLLEQQTLFCKSCDEASSELEDGLLKEDEETQDLEAVATPTTRGGSFPRDKEEQESVVKQPREGVRYSFPQQLFNIGL